MIPEWVQPYRGPFSRKEAIDLCRDLKYGNSSKYLIAEAIAKERNADLNEWDVLVQFID